jgi:hypothetical protein
MSPKSSRRRSFERSKEFTSNSNYNRSLIGETTETDSDNYLEFSNNYDINKHKQSVNNYNTNSFKRKSIDYKRQLIPQKDNYSIGKKQSKTNIWYADQESSDPYSGLSGDNQRFTTPKNSLPSPLSPFVDMKKLSMNHSFNNNNNKSNQDDYYNNNQNDSITNDLIDDEKTIGILV